MVGHFHLQGPREGVRKSALDVLQCHLQLVRIPRDGCARRAVLTGHHDSVGKILSCLFSAQTNCSHATGRVSPLGDLSTIVSRGDCFTQGQCPGSVRGGDLATGVADNGLWLDSDPLQGVDETDLDDSAQRLRKFCPMNLARAGWLTQLF